MPGVTGVPAPGKTGEGAWATAPSRCAGKVAFFLFDLQLSKPADLIPVGCCFCYPNPLGD